MRGRRGTPLPRFTRVGGATAAGFCWSFLGLRREGSQAKKNFQATGTGGGGWELIARDELQDPLSSFVPDFKPRFGGVFLCAPATDPWPVTATAMLGRGR